MEIIDQHTKKIMEGCKERAIAAGLAFQSETLEYIVTNQDMIELSPKGMIPSLYDYWVNDLEVIKGKKEYALYPNNPFETVINTRPAISFYNDNNPDWLNIMIFYHVLAHIDFMQNNIYFKNTWNDDFAGQALADKRLISLLRTQHGRWVDYLIEFARGIDNLTGYFQELSFSSKSDDKLKKIDFFFDIFLQKIKKITLPEYLKELDKYNEYIDKKIKNTDQAFISHVKIKYPEFETLYKKYLKEDKKTPADLLQYLMQNSEFLNKEKNRWMKLVIEIVRNTALYFDPQRRTKTINEGWATYWHNSLFLQDDRISSHETDYAKINAFVSSVPKVGYNPYAIGFRLFEFIKESADKGKMGYNFEKVHDANDRKEYDKHLNIGDKYLFHVRKNFCDFTFINKFVTQDFTDMYKLVLIGERINQNRMTREFYIKSKKAEDYKFYILSHLMHPPHITVSDKTTQTGTLHLIHHFEGKQLIREFIDNTLIGIEYLWGKEVKLETHIVKKDGPEKIIYTVKNKKITETKE